MNNSTHDIKKIKSILILRCEGSLGDAIIASFAFREIKKQYPNLKIGVVAFGPCHSYYSKNKHIDELYLLPIKHKIRSHQHWPELLWEAFKIRLKKYDLVLDSSDKSAVNWNAFKWLCSKKNGLYDINHNSGVFGDYSKHRCQHEKLLLENIGLTGINSNYDIYSTPESEQNFNDWLKKNQINEFICINAFGSVKERTFNKNTIETIINNSSIQTNFVIPCMPKQLKEANDIIPDNLKSHCKVFVTQNTFELVAIIKASKAVISPDTAAIHIAAGLNKPTLAFYNNYTNFYSPNNPNAMIIKTARNDVNDFDYAELKNYSDKILSIFFA